MPRRRANDSDPAQLVERLRRHLGFLGLSHTLAHLDEHLAWARRESPAPSELVERMLAEETAAKSAQRIERRLALSGMRERKTLEAFDFNFQPGLDKSLVLELATLGFARRAEDLVFTGKAGTGKSHILKALGLRACQQHISVRYARCVDLIDELYAGLADDSYPRRLRKWCRPALVIIDDVGLGQLKRRDGEPTAAHMLFNLIDRRHAHGSTSITSNIKLSQWGRYLGDASLAAAILDRLAMRAIRIDIDGPSWRQKIATERADLRRKADSKGKSTGSGTGKTKSKSNAMGKATT